MDRSSHLLCSVLALGVVGCSDDDPADPARVRVLHLAPEAGAVDLVVDGASPPAASGLTYAKSTDYLSLAAGSHDFEVRAAGTSTVALSVADQALAENGTYTVAAWGTSSVKGVVLDDSTEGLDASTLRVNVVHAAEGVGQVDLWNVPASGTPSPLITDFDEGEMDTLDLPSAAYRVGIDVDDDATPDLLFSIPALPGGQTVDVFAVLDDTGPHLVALVGGSTVVSIAPDAP